MTTINDLTTAELLTGYNSMTGQSVKRFASRAVAVERIKKGIEEQGKTEADFIALVRPEADEPVLVQEGGDFGAVAIPQPTENPTVDEAEEVAEESEAPSDAESVQAETVGDPEPSATPEADEGADSAATKGVRGKRLDLFKLTRRSEGATMAELDKVTGWYNLPRMATKKAIQAMGFVHRQEGKGMETRYWALSQEEATWFDEGQRTFIR